MNEYVLELKNIGKTFANVNVLRDVNMKIKQSEVHALLGENGAGKSTLIKIISGYYQADEGGEIIVNGECVMFKRPKDAMNASIHTIYQELTLCPDMTVAENIVMDKQERYKGIKLHKKEFRETAMEVLQRLGQDDINPESFVKELSIAKQQMVEIAKALSSNAKVILMDEPTSSISENDAVILLDIIKKLKSENITVIYISHRLHEIRQIADRITILRDGNHIQTMSIDDITDQEMINIMVGREHKDIYPQRKVCIGDEILSVQNLSSEGSFKNVSFQVHKGEIFGIGGLVGAQRTEILESLFGMRMITSGKIMLNGKKFEPQCPGNCIQNKIAFVTEDRKKNGLVLCLSVIQNMNMVNVKSNTKLGYLNWKKLKEKAIDYKKILNIKLHNINQSAGTLSGGNQQKVVLGKWLDFQPKLILFDEPTRGIDIGAKTEIYSIMNELASKGVAIIMVSSELPELIGISDRIMVMCEGEITGNLNSYEASQEKLMYMASVKNS